jgi:alkylhydroperoxidase/carboxymuconolactone decarboxylase family protein YurZ
MEKQMKVPTPEQVEGMMIEKMGALPQSLNSAKAIDPMFLVEQAMSSKSSIQSENNPFDPKTSMMLALAVSITLGSQECTQEQTKMLKKMGMSKEEMAFLVKIVKHAHSSAVMGNAKAAFDTFES